MTGWRYLFQKQKLFFFLWFVVITSPRLGIKFLPIFHISARVGSKSVCEESFCALSHDLAGTVPIISETYTFSASRIHLPHCRCLVSLMIQLITCFSLSKFTVEVINNVCKLSTSCSSNLDKCHRECFFKKGFSVDRSYHNNTKICFHRVCKSFKPFKIIFRGFKLVWNFFLFRIRVCLCFRQPLRLGRNSMKLQAVNHLTCNKVIMLDLTQFCLLEPWSAIIASPLLDTKFPNWIIVSWVCLVHNTIRLPVVRMPSFQLSNGILHRHKKEIICQLFSQKLEKQANNSIVPLQTSFFVVTWRP